MARKTPVEWPIYHTFGFESFVFLASEGNTAEKVELALASQAGLLVAQDWGKLFARACFAAQLYAEAGPLILHAK